MRIAIINYGMGNLYSIWSAVHYLGHDVIVTDNIAEIKKCDKLILPGVGSYKKAIDVIKEKKIDELLYEEIVERNKPILGICLGMQLLTSSSTEDEFRCGLNYINGKVEKFSAIAKFKIPHIGFNTVTPCKQGILYKGFNSEGIDFYFVHSYRMISSAEGVLTSYCNYIERFVASYEKNNVFGVQFHPELSQRNGMELLKNYIAF